MAQSKELVTAPAKARRLRSIALVALCAVTAAPAAAMSGADEKAKAQEVESIRISLSVAHRYRILTYRLVEAAGPTGESADFCLSVNRTRPALPVAAQWFGFPRSGTAADAAPIGLAESIPWCGSIAVATRRPIPGRNSGAGYLIIWPE